MRDNSYIPPVVLTGFKLFNQPGAGRRRLAAASRPIAETDELALRYDQDFFSFEFAALHFSAPERNRTPT